MKNLIFMFVMLISLSFGATFVYASPLSDIGETEEIEIAELEITGGIEYFDKAESTFDESRVITGLAEEDTLVIIGVYKKDSKGDLSIRDEYEIEVGKSGIFSQDIELYVGGNIIIITAEKEDKETVELEATINRKRDTIKKELENSIILPGDSLRLILTGRR